MTMRTNILSLFAALLVAPLFTLHAAKTKPTKPNIILIISDDQGFPDYSFMGNRLLETPNPDRMASQSLLNSRGYNIPVSSPSLTCLLTGRLPHQYGLPANDLTPKEIAAAPAGKGDAKRGTRDPLAHQLLSNSLILPKALNDAGLPHLSNRQALECDSQGRRLHGREDRPLRSSRGRWLIHRTQGHTAHL